MNARFRSPLRCLLATAVALAVTSTTSHANPEYAMRFANDCATACHGYLGDLPQWSPQTKCALSCAGCHISPTGGGSRRATGFEVAKNALSMDWAPAHDERLEKLNPKLNDWLTVGGDVRLLGRWGAPKRREDPTGQTSDLYQPGQEDSLWQMEGAAYIVAEPHKHVAIVVEQDFKNDYGRYYLQLKNLPLNGFIQAGRIDIPYGVKIDDHTSFSRDVIWANDSFADNRAADDGVLIGLNPGRPYLNASFSNGGRDVAPGVQIQRNSKAITFNAGYQHELFVLGGSYHRNHFYTKDEALRSQELELWGLNAGTHVWRFTLLGAYDHFRKRQPTGDFYSGYTGFSLLTFEALKGVSLRGQFDVVDPDTNSKMADDCLRRYSAGVQVHPLPFMNINAMFRYTRREASRATIDSPDDQFSGMPYKHHRELVVIVHGSF